jgi:hypothetical protein
VFGTDSLLDVVYLFVPEVAQHIPAQNIHAASFGHLVREVLDLNRRIRFGLGPQRSCKLATDCNTRRLPLMTRLNLLPSSKTTRNKANATNGSGEERSDIMAPLIAAERCMACCTWPSTIG